MEIVAASAALLAITALVGVITLALKLSAAKDDQRTSDVRATDLQGQLAIATATIATKTNEADVERKRGDALDQQLAQAEQDLEADPRGALARLLSSWKSTPRQAVPAAVGPAGAVPQPPAAASATGDHSGLLSRDE